MSEPSINDDFLDSREIDERINELESELEAMPEAERDDSDEHHELKMWMEFRKEANTRFWPHGVIFIADSHFIEYAQELAEDIGSVGRDMQWPLSFIDWPAAADALKMDYSELDIEGRTFWYRD